MGLGILLWDRASTARALSGALPWYFWISLFRSIGLKSGGSEKKTGENRSGGRCAIFSIMCCAILFPAGPEAVLRQPLEDMKACVSGGAWVQPGEGCTWIPLAHNPSSYMTRCMFYIQIFYFSRVSWLRRPSWVPYPLPYPDPSLFTPLSTSSQDE